MYFFIVKLAILKYLLYICIRRNGYTNTKKLNDMTNYKSNLEENKNLVKIGDEVVYSDACNIMNYIVTDIFEGGLELEALTDDYGVKKGEKEDIYFDSLQKGWELSKTIIDIWA